jgi:hypothetical protein
VSAGSQFHILAAKRGDLAVAQSRLGANEKDYPIPPADPRFGVGSCYEGFDLFFCEKLNRTLFVALCGDGKDPLAVQRK